MSKSIILLSFVLSSVLALAKEKTFDIYDKSVLRVCSDANNMPFSNDKGQGFENKIAELIAKKVKMQQVKYFWHPLGPGFIQNGLKAGKCDLVLSTTLKNQRLLNTNPYYQSSYVLVYRKNENISLSGLLDPSLKYLRIGIPNNIPPLSTLIDLGYEYQLSYYPLLVDSRHYSLVETAINDLLTKKIDVAILWGPMAGYYVKMNKEKLKMTIIRNQKINFKISMGVRNGEISMKHLINKVLRRNKKQINSILKQYNVPTYPWE